MPRALRSSAAPHARGHCNLRAQPVQNPATPLVSYSHFSCKPKCATPSHPTRIDQVPVSYWARANHTFLFFFLSIHLVCTRILLNRSSPPFLQFVPPGHDVPAHRSSTRHWPATRRASTRRGHDRSVWIRFSLCVIRLHWPCGS